MTDSNGLCYMRARYYSPEIRRFINQDVLLGSIDDSQSLNRFAYVNGQPVDSKDPFGLFSLSKSLNSFGKWLNSVNDKYVGGKLNKVNDKHISPTLNNINDKYITPTFQSDGTVKGALKSTAKAVGLGAATVIVAATSAEIAAGAGVIEAVSNVAGPTVTRAAVSAGGRLAAGATVAY